MLPIYSHLEMRSKIVDAESSGATRSWIYNWISHGWMEGKQRSFEKRKSLEEDKVWCICFNDSKEIGLPRTETIFWKINLNNDEKMGNCQIMKLFKNPKEEFLEKIPGKSESFN